MVDFYFLYWNYIYLLLAGFIFIVSAFIKKKHLPPISFICLLIFKVLILVCIVIALMTPTTRKLNSLKKPHYILALDYSESIDKSSFKIELEKYLKELEGIKYSKYKISYFLIEDSPVLKPIANIDIEEILSIKRQAISSIYNGIREVKEGILEEETPVFIVFTDGNETEVNSQVLQTLPLQEVHLKLVQTISREDNVQVQGVHFPSEVMPNTSVQIKVYVESKVVGIAEVILRKNSVVVAKKKVNLAVGANVIDFKQRSKQSGIENYRIEVLPTFEDKKKSNNQKYFHVNVEKPNKYLLIEGRKTKLQSLLQDLKIKYVWKKPNNLQEVNPSDYQAVLVNDIPKSEISDEFETQLLDAVSSGVGFGVFGGMKSYGLGKYYGSDFERIAPVYMPPRAYRKTTLMSFIIDASGSMLTSRKALWGSNNLLAQFLQTANDSQVPIRVAKKAAIGAVERLKGMDVSVYSFNGSFRLVSPITTLDDFNMNSVLQSIASIKAGGGTKFVPVLNDAMISVDLNQHKQSYFFFLSDGVPSDSGMIGGMLDKLIKKKIKLYTIGFGAGVDEFLLKEMASKTGGSYLKADGLNNLESIFEKAMDKVFSHPVLLNEVQLNFDKNQRFFDQKKIKLTKLNGMNMTRAKRGSKILIKSDGGLPIMVQSQYGLGKTFAWMGDSGEKWSQKLISNGSFKEIIGPNLLLISKSNEIHFQFSHQHNGRESAFTARIFDEKGAFLKNLELTGKLISKKNGKEKLVSFHETEAGVYKGSVLGDQGNEQVIRMEYSHRGKTYKLQRDILIPTNFETAFDGENEILAEEFRAQDKLIENTEGFFKAFSKYKVEAKYYTSKHSIPFLLLAIFFYILDVVFRRFRVLESLNQESSSEDRWINLANHYLQIARSQIKENEQGKAEHSYLSAQKYYKMAADNKRAEEVWKEYRINVR